jgi:hypothetical protein
MFASRLSLWCIEKMSTASYVLVHLDSLALIPIKHGAGRNATFYALPDT